MKKVFTCLALCLLIALCATTFAQAANPTYDFSYGLSDRNLWVDASSKNNKVYTDRGYVVYVDEIDCDTTTYGVCFNSVKYEGNSDLIISENDSRIEGEYLWTKRTGRYEKGYEDASRGFHCIASRADDDSTPGTIYSVSGRWNSDT